LDVNAKFQVDPATLLSYLEDCGRQVIAAHQWPLERMLATGFAVLLRRNQIEYTHPAVIDDELEIATWISEVRRVAATRQYLVRRASDGQTIARVQALGVWVNLETGRPARFSPEFLADFAPNIAP
jgi:acyl-CoA thioester hydrolase